MLMRRQYYTIRDLADMFDITPRTLRHYEDVGLLNPVRRGAKRLYSERDRVRLQLILRGRRLGFSLPEIAEMLDLYDADPTEITQLREVIRRGDEKLRQVELQISELEALRDELVAMRSRLQQALDEKLRQAHQKGCDD
ncbi:transcriptional regulator, MerR family [Alicyclobacillus acidocaldarius subsp. acidocaldarius Tc-4-1]|uniref:Transcriptional regulator, MerR family n=2 Tax=Alicyclobacillus acidocaldarius TaxID=405212 RepID=F8IDN2_ALIAT|nr:transcriptional regulator, MerR family [Alicyclobacillus acidocaldarius subsp. acidocaldarius Tc-4-1]